MRINRSPAKYNSMPCVDVAAATGDAEERDSTADSAHKSKGDLATAEASKALEQILKGVNADDPQTEVNVLKKNAERIKKEKKSYSDNSETHSVGVAGFVKRRRCCPMATCST